MALPDDDVRFARLEALWGSVWDGDAPYRWMATFGDGSKSFDWLLGQIIEEGTRNALLDLQIGNEEFDGSDGLTNR